MYFTYFFIILEIEHQIIIVVHYASDPDSRLGFFGENKLWWQ